MCKKLLAFTFISNEYVGKEMDNDLIYNGYKK